MDVLTRIFELATFIAGIAILTLLIGQADKTATVIDSATSGFDNLLRTITLQNSSLR